jgi:hypothetical protein
MAKPVKVTIDVVENGDGTWTATEPTDKREYKGASKWKAVKAMAGAREKEEAAAVRARRNAKGPRGYPGEQKIQERLKDAGIRGAGRI